MRALRRRLEELRALFRAVFLHEEPIIRWQFHALCFHPYKAVRQLLSCLRRLLALAPLHGLHMRSGCVEIGNMLEHFVPPGVAHKIAAQTATATSEVTCYSRGSSSGGTPSAEGA